ncbi:MAG: hypothetical protein D6744_09130 [Planctomycetota bacterium]|nr:MAG: hypothetical protein D6744_09130 [Planctomycetota bacterium]
MCVRPTPAALVLLVAVAFPAAAIAQSGGASQSPVRGRPPATVLLQTRLPEVVFTDAPLSDVVDALAELMNINVMVRWDRLETVGVDRDTPVTLRARNLRAEQVLWVVLNELDTDGAPLAYRLDRDLLLVTTAEEFGEIMITKVYDVRDLLMDTESVRPSFSFGTTRQFVQSVQPVVAAGAVGLQPVIGTVTSGGSLWGGYDPFDQTFDDIRDEEPPNDGDAQARRMRQLIDAIVNGVEPDSWAVNGGRGTIMPYGGLLVIRNSPLVHQQIGGPTR